MGKYLPTESEIIALHKKYAPTEELFNHAWNNKLPGFIPGKRIYPQVSIK